MKRRIQLGFGLAVWLAVAGVAFAAIYADFETSLGTFTVELDTLNAPRAVASFMGLADGSQTWRDPVTGAVRGGDAGGAFYEGTAFDSAFGSLALLGGLRSYGGTNEFREGPGYTILDEWTNGTALARGDLALVVKKGPHSGAAEFAVITSNAMSSAGFEWTRFGTVTGGGMVVVDAVAAEVTNGSGRVDVQIAIRDQDATPEETAALAAARAELPAVQEMPLGFSRETQCTSHVSFWAEPSSRGCLSTASNLTSGWSVLPGTWNMDTNAVFRSIPLTSIPGMGAGGGFLYGSQAVYPRLTARALPDLMRMAVAHTGADVQYWLDFPGATGVWALVENGTPVYVGTLINLSQQLVTANSVAVDFLIGDGLDWTRYLYWLGLDEKGATTGRFYNEQWWMNAYLDGRDWGTFEMADGWGSESASLSDTIAPARRSEAPKRESETEWPTEAWPVPLIRPDGDRDVFRGFKPDYP